MGVSKGSWEEYQKLYGGSSGNNTGNTNLGDSNGGLVTGTADITKYKKKIQTGKFGEQANSGSFGDFVGFKTGTGSAPSWLTYTPTTKHVATINGDKVTEKDVTDYETNDEGRRETTAGQFAGDRASALETNLSPVEFDELMADENARNSYIADKSKYYSGLYDEAKKNENSAYNTDVATRRADNLNDAEAVAEYIYGLVESGEINDAQKEDLITWFDNELQQGNATGTTWSLQNVYTNLENQKAQEAEDARVEEEERSQKELLRNLDRANGGNGILDEDVTEQANTLLFVMAEGGSVDDMIDNALRWQKTTGATDEQMDQLFTKLDIVATSALGKDTNYKQKYLDKINEVPDMDKDQIRSEAEAGIAEEEARIKAETVAEYTQKYPGINANVLQEYVDTAIETAKGDPNSELGKYYNILEQLDNTPDVSEEENQYDDQVYINASKKYGTDIYNDEGIDFTNTTTGEEDNIPTSIALLYLEDYLAETGQDKYYKDASTALESFMHDPSFVKYISESKPDWENNATPDLSGTAVLDLEQGRAENATPSDRDLKSGTADYASNNGGDLKFAPADYVELYNKYIGENAPGRDDLLIEQPSASDFSIKQDATAFASRTASPVFQKARYWELYNEYITNNYPDRTDLLHQ